MVEGEHAHVRAYLSTWLGRNSDRAAFREAERAILMQLSTPYGDDDDACTALRDSLRHQTQQVLHRDVPDKELDSAVLALMLRHRDDVREITPKASMTASVGLTPSSMAPSPYTPRARAIPPPTTIRGIENDSHPTSAMAWPPPSPHDEEEDEFSPFTSMAGLGTVPPAPAPVPAQAQAQAPVQLPDLSTMSLHAEANAPILTPLEVFCSVFLAHNAGLFADEPDPTQRLERASRTIQHALACSNYDVSVALQIVKDAHESGIDILAIEPQSVASDESTTRVCRFFLAGECRRSDCRFSHDLNKALCRFWLRGQCLNDSCSFLHDYEALSELAQSIAVAPAPPAPAPEPEPMWIPRPKLDASQTPWAVAAKSSKAPTPAPTMTAAPKKPPAPALSQRIPLRAPSLLPTLATGSALAIDMGKLRAAQPKNQDAWKTTTALLHARHDRLRERLQVGAGGDAGGWGSSAQASHERGARGLRGRWMGGGLGVCLGVARPQVGGATLSLDERTEVVLDLHGLHVNEALEACENFLLALETEGFRGLAYVCVGAGKHSARSGGRLASSILSFLQSWAYPHAEYDGVIACDPCTHL